MKHDYDALTPAQKSKLTRQLNKLDEQRHSAYRLQWEIYRTKSDALYEEQRPQREQIQQEATQKIEALRAEILAIDEQMRKDVSALNTEHRDTCHPEFEEYNKAQTLAFQWHKGKREELINAFYAEVEASN